MSKAFISLDHGRVFKIASEEIAVEVGLVMVDGSDCPESKRMFEKVPNE